MITLTEITNKEKKHVFQNIISLGHCCAPAMQLEKFGYRKASYPFDWLIIRDFRLVLELIRNGYSNTGFLEEEYFAQAKIKKNHYQNFKTKVRFLHDFDAYLPFKEQFPMFCQKYKRRMDRFQKDILQPTLFIRYIGDQEELNFISENLMEIESIIKEKCSDNEILFVCDETLTPCIDIFITKSDKGKINFNFIEDGKGLLDWLHMNYVSELSFHPKKKSVIKNIKNKLESHFKKEYTHHIVYQDLD